MPTEKHPYLQYFDPKRIHRFLIIGTFPPNKEVRQGRSSFANYFYGNKGSLWPILDQTNLFPKNAFKTFDTIRDWERKYSVGITDVLKSCDRKEGRKGSSDDADLVISAKDLNTSLRDYILQNIKEIESIYFTSSGKSPATNSAYFWFSQLMGNSFITKYKSKLVTKLPSPSGRYLTSTAIFSNNENNYGLNRFFLQFLKENNFTAAINIAERTFAEKKEKIQRALAAGEKASTVKQIRLPGTEKDYPSLYRVKKYKVAFSLVKEYETINLKNND